MRPSGLTTRSLYFVNAPVDYALIGGLSVALYAVLALAQDAMTAETIRRWNLAASLAWLCNWPHFAATNYRLYHSKRNIVQYPMTAIVLPFVMLAAVAASCASPQGVAPWLVKLFLIWSPYHYSGQSLGISLIYARRAGVVVGRLERLALAGFIFGSFAFSTARAEVVMATRSYYGITYPTLGLPPVVPLAASAVMWLCGAVCLAFAVRRSLREHQLLPPLILLPALAQFIWFIPGGRLQAFNEFVPFFHGLQYLLIAWAMQLKEKQAEQGIPPSPRYVLLESLRWGAGVLLGGVCLFWLLPRVGTMTGLSLQVSEPIVIAAVQIHHFFVDGVIWKLKNPKVGSPLLVSIEELIGPAPRAAGQPA